jgi:hypothetical protein
VVAATVAATAVSGALAGGEFLRQMPGSPDMVDVSSDVKRNCSQVERRETADGVLLTVLFAPEFENVVAASLEMMEKAHDALVAGLGISFQVSGRLYLVPMDAFPESIRVRDPDPGSPAWVFLRAESPDDVKLSVIEGVVYGSFSHEWAHAVLDEKYGSKARLWKARWIVEGMATYAQHLVQWHLAPSTSDPWQGLRLPIFTLAETSLEELVPWKYPKTLPPPQLARDRGYYLAAAGLFLRVREKSGSAGVISLLDHLKEDRKIRAKEIEAALNVVTGHGFKQLSSITPEERDAAFFEALAALDGPARSRRMYGLALLERFPERSDRYMERVSRLLESPEVDGGLRMAAEELIGRAQVD